MIGPGQHLEPNGDPVGGSPPVSAVTDDAPIPRLAAAVIPGRVWSLLAATLRPAVVVPVGLAVGACIPLSLLTAGPSLCPFKLLTGLPCPGCGMTRSVVALLHGDPATSFYFHPLGLPMVAALVLMALVDAWAWWRGSRPGRRPVPSSWLPERLMLTPAPWVAIGALTLVWLIRLPLYMLGTWTF